MTYPVNLVILSIYKFFECNKMKKVLQKILMQHPVFRLISKPFLVVSYS